MQSPIQARYRYVVVRGRTWQYAVLDRVTDKFVADELTREEARKIVKGRNNP